MHQPPEKVLSGISQLLCRTYYGAYSLLYFLAQIIKIPGRSRCIKNISEMTQVIDGQKCRTAIILNDMPKFKNFRMVFLDYVLKPIPECSDITLKCFFLSIRHLVIRWITAIFPGCFPIEIIKDLIIIHRCLIPTFTHLRQFIHLNNLPHSIQCGRNRPCSIHQNICLTFQRRQTYQIVSQCGIRLDGRIKDIYCVGNNRHLSGL